MADDKQQDLKRRLTGTTPPPLPSAPMVTDDPGPRADTNDDLYPVGRGGRIDYVALAKVVAKVLTIVGAAIIGLIGPAYTAYSAAKERAAQEARAVQAGKEESDVRNEAGFQAVRSDVEAMKKELYELRKEKAERARLDAIRARRAARAAGRPASLAPAPLPSLPAPPKPLPKDLDQAAAQIEKKAAPPAPTVVPLPVAPHD